MKNQGYRSHPGVAAVLSFLFSGLGQIYNGQFKKGFTIMFFSALSMILTILGAILIGHWLYKTISFILLIWGIIFFIGGITSICFLGIFSIMDAFIQAKTINYSE